MCVISVSHYLVFPGLSVGDAPQCLYSPPPSPLHPAISPSHRWDASFRNVEATRTHTRERFQKSSVILIDHGSRPLSARHWISVCVIEQNKRARPRKWRPVGCTLHRLPSSFVSWGNCEKSVKVYLPQKKASLFIFLLHQS